MSQVFNIVDLFYASVQKHPDKLAIIYKDEKVTFKDFQKSVDDTAQYFLSKGIRKGDRVLIFVPMSLDLYRSVLALFRIGATAVFLDEWVSFKRLDACCKIADCKAFIGVFKARVLSLFSSELRKIPIKLGTKYSKVNTQTPFDTTEQNDTALITFTTGSTGTPKAAKRTHRFLLAQFKALINKIQPQESDISMPVLPIVLLINLGTGTTSVIADFKASKPNSLKPEKVLDQMRKNGVNTLIASPFFVKQISKYLLRRHSDLPNLQKVFTGGAPVFPHEASIYVAALPQAKIEIVYGSTEAEPISAISARELAKDLDKPSSKGLKVGQIDDCAQVKIIPITEEVLSFSSEEDLNSKSLPLGSIGEIIVSGDHVLREYFNNEEAIKRNKIFIGTECWHHTGDSGFLDENGQLYLTGRCNTLINWNGEILAPFVYEGIFQSIIGVEMGTLLLVSSKLIAIIELSLSSDKNQVVEQINKLDQSFDKVLFLKKIPRDPRHNSKIDYEQLKDLVKK